MKKTVIIAIVVVYLASILVVNFFGLQMVVSSPTVYVDQIVMNEIDHVGGAETWSAPPDDDGLVSYRFRFVAGDYTVDNLEYNPNVVKLDYVVLPEKATNKDVDILYPPEVADSIVVNKEEGTITFLKRVTVKITLLAKDGSLAKAEFWISARRAQE